MKKIITSLLFTSLCNAAISSKADTQTYSFHSHGNGSTFEFPGLRLMGEVTGELKLERNSLGDFPPSNSEFDISLLTFDFEFAPDLVATNFDFNPNTGTYMASVNNAWVFKTVNVEVLHVDAQAQNFAYRISVETVKDLTGDNFPGPFFSDAILLEGSGFLVNETPFKTVDAADAIVDGKRLSIRLNRNLGSNANPSNGVIGGGIELKILWFGHGEKSFFIPSPNEKIKPIAIVLESFDIGGETEYQYFVRYEEEFGGIGETFREPLRPILDDLFPRF